MDRVSGWKVRIGAGWTPALVAALTLLAYALRVYRLDAVSLRGDESLTVLFSAYPLPELIEGIRTVEPNPPLYYFLLRGAMILFGQYDWTMRYVSTLFGVLSVPLVYGLGRALFAEDGRPGRAGDLPLGAAVGLLAAALLAINPFQIWHSQDVRNYTLWPALSMASLTLMLRALRGDRWPLWVGYALVALTSLYTHYYDVFVVLAANAYVFASYWRLRALLKRWIVVQAVLAALYLPWPLLGSSRPFTYAGTSGDVPGLLYIARQTLSALVLGETLPQSISRTLAPALALLVLLGLGYAWRMERRTERTRVRSRPYAFLLFYLAVPIFCVFLVTRVRPLFWVRYMNVIAPGFYLSLSLALVALTQVRVRRAPPLAAVVGVALLLVPSAYSLYGHYYDRSYRKSPDWRGLAAHLEAHVEAGDVIVENYPDPTLSYYYRGPARRLVLPDRSAVDQVGALAVDRKATGETLRRLLAEHRRLWLLPQRSSWDPEGFVESSLNRRARKVHEEHAAGFRLAVYEQAEHPVLSIVHPMDARLEEKIRLLGYDVRQEAGCGPTKSAQEGGESTVRLIGVASGTCVVQLTLYWEVLEPVDAAYTVFVHLVDERLGQIAAQQDGQPQGGGFPTSEWLARDIIADPHPLALPADLSAGTYVLRVGMYQLESGARLPAVDGAGRRWPEDAIRLDRTIEVK